MDALSLWVPLCKVNKYLLNGPLDTEMNLGYSLEDLNHSPGINTKKK